MIIYGLQKFVSVLISEFKKKSDSFEASPRKNRRRTRRLGNPFEALEGVHLSLRGPFIAAEAAPSVSSPQKQNP